ncbi:hypothetical protein AtubIFM54640_007515 [Aspergillus tubingensis]|nr:hypothetical protein AtubIFM54640_007515 [Aspergillus tubingensis]
MEGSSEELEPPNITQEAAAGSEEVQELDKQGPSLQSESFDPQQILLEAIDRRRQQYNPRQAFFLSNLGFDIHNPVRHTGNSPSEFLFVPNDQVTAAQTGFDESLFVPQEEYSSLYLPPSGPDVPPMSPDDQNILELLQGDTSPPVQQLSQVAPHSSASASQIGNAGTAAAPADDEEDPRLSAPSCVDLLSSSSSTSGNTDVPVEDFPDDTGDQSCPTEWPDEELEASTRTDLSKRQFNSIKKWFDSLEKPSVADEIRLEKARQQEYARKERVARRKALENQSELFDSEIDEPDESTSRQVPVEKRTESSHDVPVKRQPKQRRQNRISADEKRKSKELGLAVVLARQKKREMSKRAPRKRKDRGFDNGIPGPSKRPKRGPLGTKKYLEYLLSSGVVEDAHVNASLDAIPASIDKNKMKALKRLVATIPSVDQKEAKSDKKKILEATRKFTCSPRSDGKLGWNIKGMKTSLYHYQLLGAAFMRDRENSSEGPFGGLLCDIMGFGKTIQALANIVDGKPFDPEDPEKTTLIVVPSHLVTHWKTQINRHCDEKAIGDVLIYKASSRLESLNTVGSLAKYDVIITTYDEVRRSYPPMKLTDSIKDDEKLSAWWDQSFDTETGPLHKIKFHRIILDGMLSPSRSLLPFGINRESRFDAQFAEGHTIKNHISSVSIAVRSLTGHYKWILSGTPVHNHLEEFYPLFDFLGVPGIKDAGVFIKNFCSDDEGHDRLVNLLRAFLFRRTHKSRLFSLPVIKLPDVNERIVRVQFCAVERELYNAISEVFIENINGCAHFDQPKHLYCEECYYSLRMDKDNMLMEPKCVNCRVLITEAAYFKEEGNEKTQGAWIHGVTIRKEKQRQKRTTTKKQSRSSIRQITAPRADETDEEPDADEDTDWIRACAQHMPSAKLTKIREILTEWLAQESSGKIVIFTQFLDFVEILSTMCEAEGWPFVLLTGKLGLSVRENNMKTFSDKNSEVRILIASLKAGGIGLDLSAANKCILVDLWWNEAIQEQAFCRLFRIGQESEVEFVKLIVDNSIDDYLLNLQTHKTAVITGAMGDGVLAGRDTIEDLLRMFADVEKDSRGVLHLRAKTASRDIRIGAGFRPSFGVF